MILNFFFNFSKKMGRSGDGKRNILWGWPHSKNRVLLKTRIADCERDGKDKSTRFLRGSWFAVFPEKISKKAKRLCETDIKKKDSFEARSSIFMINIPVIVTVEHSPPKTNRKNHAGYSRSSGGEKQIPPRCKRSHLVVFHARSRWW